MWKTGYSRLLERSTADVADNKGRSSEQSARYRIGDVVAAGSPRVTEARLASYAGSQAVIRVLASHTTEVDFGLTAAEPHLTPTIVAEHPLVDAGCALSFEIWLAIIDHR